MERFDEREIATAVRAATTAARAARTTARSAREAASAAEEAASAAEEAASAAEEAARVAERRAISPNNRFEFTHNDRNYKISLETLEMIFSHFDNENLLTCHFVCKNWKAMIQDYIWRRKAGLTVHEDFSRHHNVPWQVYHWICKTNRNPFEKNLLKNHSGENGLEHWEVCERLRDNWTFENPPVGVPELPVDEDPIFEGKQFCFATFRGSKSQTVDLVNAGFHPYIMDKFQPPIEVSEYYYCNPEDPIDFQYIRSTDAHRPIYFFQKGESGEQENKWTKKTNNISMKYGPGLTKFQYLFSGSSSSEIINCKMAGACVKVKFPYITPRGHPSRNQ